MQRCAVAVLLSIAPLACAQPPALEVVARDDTGRPVPSYILVDRIRIAVTDDNGRYVFDDVERCPTGSAVNAEPRERASLYLLPSTTGYCRLVDGALRLTLSRKRLLRNATLSYIAAIGAGDWGTAARVGNQVVVIARRHEQPLDPAFARGVQAAAGKRFELELQLAIADESQRDESDSYADIDPPNTHEQQTDQQPARADRNSSRHQRFSRAASVRDPFTPPVGTVEQLLRDARAQVGADGDLGRSLDAAEALLEGLSSTDGARAAE